MLPLDLLTLIIHDGKCHRQVVGIHKLSSTAQEVATFLKLPNLKLYTGHCLRRTSATLLVNAGADITGLKRHGGWQSTTVAEGYIDDSISNKIETSNRILAPTSSTEERNIGTRSSNAVLTSTDSVPDDVLLEANSALSKIIPEKSKLLYEKGYINFCEWRKKKQLKKMLSVKENVDISRFHQHKSTGYKPKKSRVFAREDLEKFLDTAPDVNYLLLKIVLIMGVSGDSRIGELVAMSVDNIEDRGNVLVVTIPDTKTYKERIFTVVNGSNVIRAIDVLRKYVELRPRNVPHRRFFLTYKNQKCTVQPNFLELKILMGGHSFRRSSATLLAEAGADLSVLKRLGGWRSDSVEEGYIEQSVKNKIQISKKILGEGTASNTFGSSEVVISSVTSNKTDDQISDDKLQVSSAENQLFRNLVSNVSEQVSIPVNRGCQFELHGFDEPNPLPIQMEN
ncbi:hypothetical protein NQ315_014411 [Exocentrus adspersus]|uniref:Tyr recombinase domain-containing protein n=1 Tax=Exocentrus adspersus TaxID=1586481 RepID=A0AAV8VF84_9CUCU|nr:hypothetical protein NQ315_014411 [Exocentrus adspersus]